MKLPTRKRQVGTPTSLPKEFLKTVAELFKKQFTKEIKGSEFLVYGNLFSDEVILCLSLTNAKSLKAASMHISADLGKGVAESPEKVTEQLKSMVDIAASWFAQCFEGGKGFESVVLALAEMDTTWQPVDWEGMTLHVKLNKDNYALEKAADSFLKKAGFEEEGEDPLDDLDIDDAGDLEDEDGGRGNLH